MKENENGTPTKNGNKGLVAVLAIIIIAILAGVAYYFLKPTSPKDIFVGGIDSVLNQSSEKLQSNVDKINTTLTLSGNIESNDEQVKQLAQYINEGKITYNVQIDRNAKKALIGANIDYKGENLLNGKLFYTNDDNIYFYVQDLFDKYFKVNLKDAVEDEDSLTSIKNMFEGNLASTEKVNVKKAASIIKEEISKNLKDDYFSKEKVDGMTKNTMKLTVVEFKKVITNIVTSLKGNEEFLKCFEKTEEVKKALEETIEGLSDTNENYDNKDLELSLYTNGMKNEINKFEAKIPTSKEAFIILTIVKTENNKFEIKIDADEYGKITLNMEVNNETNTDLDGIDISNNVEINNMSQADMFKLYSNLANMKIYKYIAPYLMSQSGALGY